MDNMTLYNKWRSVPEEACKKITAGKLKDFTDINPMWRLKMLTETFGPCGFGWYIEDSSYWKEDLGANEIAAFCQVKLKVKHPETGEWSAPIIGIGGSKLAGKGRWRNKTVAFRVSEDEGKLIDKCVALSGLSKQDYIIRRLQCRDVVVQGNPRVYKALRNQMAEIYEELKRLESVSGANDELLYTIQLVAETMNGLKGECE